MLMPRPAEFYSSHLLVNSFESIYDRNWSLVSRSGPFAYLQQWRHRQRPASTSTSSVTGGRFVTPTNYSSRGGLVTYSTGDIRYSDNAGYYYLVDGPGMDYWQDHRLLFGLMDVPSWVWSALEIRALNKLKNSDVDFGVMLAESHQTADLFSTNAKRIAKQVSNFSRSNPKDFAKAALYSGSKNWKKVPNSWLELVYGWSPLMQDISGAMSALEKRNDAMGATFRVASKKSWSESKDFPSLAFCIDQVLNARVDCKFEAKVVLNYRLRNYLLAKLSSLGLANPASIVWEKTKYSFVVDWFLPVGNWISALGGDFGYDFLSGCRSQMRTGRVDKGSVDLLNTPYRSENLISVRGNVWRFDRSIYASSPVPGLYLKSPVSPTHIANAMSLLVQAFRRR